MKPTLVLVGLVAGVVVYRIATRRPERPAQPDDMAVPFLDSRNSATYLFNRRTGVVSSYN